MSLISSTSNSYLGALGAGLVYGMAVCTASCLPYLAGYIAGVGAGFRKGFSITLIFSSGRIAGYAVIGAVVGILSGLLRLFVSADALSPFQIYSAIAFGVVTILIGVFVLIKYRSPKCDCNPAATSKLAAAGKRRFGFDFGAFSLGLSRGLILCPPLMAFLLVSVPFSSPLASVSLAVLFGVGTVLSPMLLLGGATGWLLNKAPLFRKYVSIGGGGILILLGAVSVVNSVIHL